MIASPRRFAWVLLALTVLGLALRVAVVVVVDPDVPEVGDATAYHLLANHLADGHGYVRPFDLTLLGEVRPTAEYPPLFPGVLSLAARAGLTTVRGQRLVAGVLGALSVAAIGALGRRFAGPGAGLVAAGLAAVHPMLFLSDATLMPESLYLLLVAGALLAAYRAAERPSAVRFVTLGVAGGLAALTRAEGLLLTVFLVALLARRRPEDEENRTRRTLLAGVAVLAALAVVAPWTVRNQVRFGQIVPISNNLGTVLAGANCDRTYGGATIGFWLYTENGDCFTGFDQRDLARTNEAVVAARHRAEGIAYARAHVERLPVVGAVRVLRTWGLYAPAQQARLESLEGRPVRWQRAGMALHWLVLVAAAGGVVLARREGRLLWPLLSAVVAATLTALVTYGNQRFRAPAEPALLVLAASFLVSSLARRRRAPRSRAAG